MINPDIKIVEKIDISDRVASLRTQAIDFCRLAKRSNHTKGVFLSEGESGEIGMRISGMTNSEAIAILEEAKFLILTNKWI